jgi:hypothetical protein
VRANRRLLGILTLAVLVRAGLLTVAAGDLARVRRSDSGAYEALAAGLLARGAFGAAVETGAPPEVLRTPGYPAFLAATSALVGDRLPLDGGSFPVVLLVQALVGVAVCALTHRLATMLLAGPAALADLAALLVAIDVPSACHSVLLLTETAFALLVAAALAAAWAARRTGSVAWAAAAGLLTGLSTLVRPIALYLAGLVALWGLLAVPGRRGRRLAAACAAGCLALAPPLGWMARNAALGQGFVLSGIEGANLLIYRAAPVLARARGITWSAAADELLGRFGYVPGQRFQWDAANSRAAGRMALAILVAHPLESLAVLADGAIRVWAGPGNSDLMVLLGASPADPASPTPVTGPPALRLVAWTGCALGWGCRIVGNVGMLAGVVVLARRRRGVELAFLAVPVLYFTLLAASPGAYARLRVPATPAACVLVAAALLGRGSSSSSSSSSRPDPDGTRTGRTDVGADPAAGAAASHDARAAARIADERRGADRARLDADLALRPLPREAGVVHDDRDAQLDLRLADRGERSGGTGPGAGHIGAQVARDARRQESGRHVGVRARPAGQTDRPVRTGARACGRSLAGRQEQRLHEGTGRPEVGARQDVELLLDALRDDPAQPRQPLPEQRAAVEPLVSVVGHRTATGRDARPATAGGPQAAQRPRL